jgi:hypothetical protein
MACLVTLAGGRSGEGGAGRLARPEAASRCVT